MQEPSFNKNNNKLYIFGSLAFIVGYLVAFIIHSNAVFKGKEEAQEIRQSGYAFINPLLDCEIGGETASEQYIPFEGEIKQRINKEIIDKNPDTFVSLYFRNLNNGPWFGINETENFTPASLMKVPLMIAFLKESETHPEILNKEIVYDKKREIGYTPIVEPDQKLQVGQSYRAEELMERMIKYSDNEAASLLLENIPNSTVEKVYQDLGLPVPGLTATENYMSVKEYASFFRILYNAAYLSKANSEKALELLTKTNYKKGLVASLPQDLPVAHKFGERELTNSPMRFQLHDCGTIYYEKYPYLLCIMTRGNDMDKQAQVISGISKIVFDEIKNKHP